MTVRDLMCQISMRRNAVQLREVDLFWAVLLNKTRFIGTFDTARRMFKSVRHLSNITELDFYLPTKSMRHALMNAVENS